MDVAATLIKDAADIDANIIFGVATDPTLDDEMIVTVIATGFGTPTEPVAEQPATPVAPAAPVQTPVASAPVSAPVAEDDSGDDDISDIFNMFKNRS